MPLRRTILLGVGCRGRRAPASSSILALFSPLSSTTPSRSATGLVVQQLHTRPRHRPYTRVAINKRWNSCNVPTVVTIHDRAAATICFSSKRYFSGATSNRRPERRRRASRRNTSSAGKIRGSKKGTIQKPHPRNSFQGTYDMDELCKVYPSLGQHIIHPDETKEMQNKDNSRPQIHVIRQTINFADQAAVRALNTALLVSDYGIAPNYEDILPTESLVPPVPGRADYIHYIADVLSEAVGERGIPQGSAVRGLDIGTGASAIYPLLANSVYGWSMVGSEVNPPSIKSAREIVETNNLQDLIDVRLQESPQSIFDGIWGPEEDMDFVMCNPPFFPSLEAFQAENARKLRGLAKGGANKQSRGPIARPGPEQRTKRKASNNFGGTDSELWCEGGEVDFVKHMVNESKRYADQCLWFTSLVSRKENMAKIVKHLKQGGSRLKPVLVRKLTMGAGMKSASILLWTFMDKMERQAWASKRWLG